MASAANVCLGSSVNLSLQNTTSGSGVSYQWQSGPSSSGPWTNFGGNFAGQKAYLSGPPPMIEACIGTLMQGRLFERDIYTEKFLSAADAQATRSPLFQRV